MSESIKEIQMDKGYTIENIRGTQKYFDALESLIKHEYCELIIELIDSAKFDGCCSLFSEIKKDAEQKALEDL